MSTRTSRHGPQSSAGKPGKQSKGGKKGRKSVAPVRVGKDRNWGPIAMFAAVGLIAAGIVGWAVIALLQSEDSELGQRAEGIDGVVNYYETEADLSSAHQSGPLSYEMSPPAGGPHNDTWQTCNGVVYDAPIASEHAVHSMEHGAVWVTYQPDLPQDQVDELANTVEGTDYLMMSPYEGLDAPISLQAWGYQLKVDDASDPRVTEFIRTFRLNAAIEDATCNGGTTHTGTTPIG